MTRAEVVKLLRERFGEVDKWLTAPDWWPSDLESAEALLRRLPQVKVREIGRSAGGRPILAAEWGEKEPLETTANSLASAFAAAGTRPDPLNLFPPAFYGRQRRTRQVLVIQGALHGMEIDGTVAALNLLHILHTGTDLRGKPWDRLRAEAAKLRICVIPFLNADGRARSPFHHFVGASNELCQFVHMGTWKDGRPIVYPDHKAIWPLPLAEVGFLGAYFNDRGVNLQYDSCVPHRQPETTAWMQYYLDERPDCVLICHSNAGSLMGNPDTFLPVPFQHQQSRVAGLVRQYIFDHGQRAGRTTYAQLPDFGTPNFNQHCGVYHTCGALPLMCEFPCGLPGRPYTMDECLDIGLLVLEAICFFANRDGFRPLAVWDRRSV